MRRFTTGETIDIIIKTIAFILTQEINEYNMKNIAIILITITTYIINHIIENRGNTLAIKHLIHKTIETTLETIAILYILNLLV